MTNSITKICRDCGRGPDEVNFTYNKRSADKLDYLCSECKSKRYNEHYYEKLQTERARNRKRYESERDTRSNSHYKRKYGITVDTYKEMLAEQSGVCAICHKPESACSKGNILPLAVDHCHKTGKVRGLLCNRCNRVLALFDDDIEIMKSAIDYLH